MPHDLPQKGEINVLRRITATLAGLAVMLGLTVALSPPVQAVASDWCTGANQYIDQETGNCVTNTVMAGQLETTVNEHLGGKAKLALLTKGNVVFNVHTKSIPRRQINRCWTVKPGTVIKNEVIDKNTGQKIIINWVVPANDNKFCTKKGHGNQVYKYSCDNRTWNVPGQPHQPKAPMPVTRGKFKVVDWAMWKATLKSILEKHLGGSLTVESRDGSCKASSSFDNYVRVRIYLSARFRSRTRVEALAKGVREVETEARTSTKANGRLSDKIDLTIHNTLSAMCATQPPQEEKSITITSFTDLNMIAAGKNSGPAQFTVNGSEAGGSVTVDPNIGGVSTCNSSTPQGSLTFSNLAAGNNSLCVIIYAPNDADKPRSMTVTYTAILGTARDVKTDQVVIQYPTQP